MIVSLIAAYAVSDNAIGIRGDLPWHLPADLRRFKQLTMGHTLIMGRRTHQSLGGRVLPGRRIIVLSRTLNRRPPNADRVADSLARALEIAERELGESEVFITGGEEVYDLALEKDLVDRMYLTLVEAEIEADTFFPTFDPDKWQVLSCESHPADDRHRYPFTFTTLERSISLD